MMLNFTIWISVFLLGLLPKSPEKASSEPAFTTREYTEEATIVEETPAAMSMRLFDEMELTGIINQDAFIAAYTTMLKHGRTERSVLAIADMTLPSTEKRLYLVDIETKKFIMRTWVAHGTNTGELTAKFFSNKEGSHKTSKGLYDIGHRIISPKHGPALLLYGLEKGLNDNAERREIIMHKANYVSQKFIQENGALGRSWGCPAVSEKAMTAMLKHLTGKGLLYVYGA